MTNDKRVKCESEFVPRKYWKYLAAFVVGMWVMFFIGLYELPLFGEARLYFLDVGQGDAILIRSPEGHNILVDGGPKSVVMSELSEVLPFFGRDIDLMVLTHPHADHIEGLVEVLKRYEVGALLLTGIAYDNNYYEEFLKDVFELRDRGDLDVYIAESSVDFRVGSVYLDVLYPIESLAGRKIGNLNNSSIVMRVSLLGGGGFGASGWRSVLLSGDCEVECEEEVLEAGFDIDADVMKAGHHGSKTAASEEFVRAVSPEVVVIQCGVENKFRHPHAETLRTFYRFGVREVWRNDLDGRVEIL
ncbi:MBL fold metallo-hydrolase [Candidatus Peregrinibacteria bacterium]|nr:MBL fold metallo-hydrolase [Candidatus Peregrinibacteria bacterium]